MDRQMLEFQRNALLGKISAEPLCAQYKAAWRSCGDDKEMLVRLAMQQQSIPYFSYACYERLGVTKDYIKKNFAEYINGNKVLEDVESVKGYTYQLYVDFKGDFKAVADVTSLMWCNDTSVNIEATKCPLFYVSNNSDVHFVLDGYNSIRIYLFDESKVMIDDADETCDVLVYRYNSRAVVDTGKFCLGKVKIFNKTLRL
jgi:hypothetical protein